jgi:hypothetical protein
MKTLILALAMRIGAMAMASSVCAGVKELTGYWKNVDPESRGGTLLEIRVTGANITVQPWGKCHPTDCDWGRVTM